MQPPAESSMAWTEDGEEFVCSLVDDIFESAAAVVAEKALEAKVQPFAQQWVMTALIAAVNCQFMQIDEGENLLGEDAGAWEIDNEPVPSPVDTWATHSIPLRHKPKPPTPDIKQMEDDNHMRSQRRRSRHNSVAKHRRSIQHANTLNFSDSGASRSVAREAPFKNIHTNARVDMREELDISGLNPRRFRSASFAGRGNSDEPERNLPVPTKDAKKARIKTAKCSVKKHEQEATNAVVSNVEKEDVVPKSNTQDMPKSSLRTNSQVLKPQYGPQERSTAGQGDFDNIFSQQADRELAGIARIARETNGSFAYDFKGKLIPVKKIDGNILPKYSFQTKISITTNVSGGPNNGTNVGSQEGLDTKASTAITKSHVPRMPKAPKIRKAPTRKVKVV